MRWKWLFGSVLALTVVLIFVATRRRYAKRAAFPTTTTVTRLPIRAPLVRPDLRVMATLRANEKRTSTLFMTVDSGATGVTMPATAYHALGLETLRGVTIRSGDPFGRILTHDAGEVPEMILGSLTVREVITALGDAPVLGQSILTHAPWEIDWDRGMLTLGGNAWAGDARTTLIPVRHEADGEVVRILVDGVPIDMILDTGAFVSMIPETRGDGLSARRLPPTILGSVGGETIVRRAFVGNVKLGALDVGVNEFAAVATAGRRATFGLLGLDVLSRYQLQVVPGKHLALRPRGDVRQMTAERLARWSFLPTSCEHPGCVHGELSEGSKLTVTLDADLAQSIEVLLGCKGDRDDTFVPTGSSFGFGHPPAIARHVRVRMPGIRRGEALHTTIPNASLWFDAECRTLEALDVSPLAPVTAAEVNDAPTEAAELHAMYWP